jgi:glycosyltransferase involved in cell wall biosynthesis
MPVFNGERYVEAAVRSLLGQTYGDFVLLVSDNASTDRTAEICGDLASEDARIRYSRQARNVGANRNFNLLVRAAEEQFSPRWFKWAAHDDLCEPPFLQRCIDVLAARPEVVLAYPRTVMVDEHGSEIPGTGDPGPKGTGPDRLARFREILDDEFGVFYIFGVHRTAALCSTTLFGSHWPPDKALASWLALLGPFDQVPEPLFRRRTHPEQSSSLTLRNQGRWSSTGLRGFVPSPVWATRAYLEGVRSAPLTAAERRRAYGEVARKYLDGDKWKRVLLPGRDNYLGWHGRARDSVALELGAATPAGGGATS